MRIVLLLLALIVSASGARAAIHRDALWFVLRSCVVAQNTAGIPFPCLAVNLASSTGPGYAVLRAPFNPPSVLVVPVEKIEGTESPILQPPEPRAYWQAALQSRRFVVDALGGRIPLTEVALAVNSSVGRSHRLDPVDNGHPRADQLLALAHGAAGILRSMTQTLAAGRARPTVRGEQS